MENKPNYFVRVLLVSFVIALVVMVFMSFLVAQPKYQISAGLITVLGIITVLILSESFNNLSLGKIINLKREIQTKEAEKSNVKQENKELRQELFKIISNIQQSQINNTYNVPSDEWFTKILGVVKADDSEKEEEAEEQQNSQKEMESIDTEVEKKNLSRAEERERQKTAKIIGIKKYADKLSIPNSEIIQGAEFSQAFDEIDPIMSRRIIFDGYIKGVNQERFIEVKLKRANSFLYFDRIYVMLNKIFLYRKAKGISAELILLMLEIEGDEQLHRHTNTDKFYNYFQSAIANKLLRIEHLIITQNEMSEYKSSGQLSLF